VQEQDRDSDVGEVESPRPELHAALVPLSLAARRQPGPPAGSHEVAKLARLELERRIGLTPARRVTPGLTHPVPAPWLKAR